MAIRATQRLSGQLGRTLGADIQALSRSQQQLRNRSDARARQPCDRLWAQHGWRKDGRALPFRGGAQKLSLLETEKGALASLMTQNVRICMVGHCCLSVLHRDRVRDWVSPASALSAAAVAIIMGGSDVRLYSKRPCHHDIPYYGTRKEKAPRHERRPSLEAPSAPSRSNTKTQWTFRLYGGYVGWQNR